MAGRTKLALLLALAALAVGLAACGGDDGDSTTTAPTAQQSGEAGGTNGSDAPSASGDEGSTGGDAADDSQSKPDRPEEPADSTGGGSEPADSGSASTEPGEAGFSSQSKPFRTPGGDNSIQTFGAEASAAEREAASAVLESYMRARAARNHAAECRYLSPTVVEPIEDLVKAAPEAKGKGCAGALEMLLGKAPPSASANTLDGTIDSLRVDSERAFALYHGSDGADYFMPMALEGGSWKVAGLAPTEFPDV